MCQLNPKKLFTLNSTRTLGICFWLVLSWPAQAQDLLIPSSDAAFPLAQRDHPRAACLYRFLQDLGWRFTPGTGTTMKIVAGTPCERADLTEAHDAGDLQAELPASVQLQADPQRWLADLDALINHPATLCAYKFRLGNAARAAIDKLAANSSYRFSGLQFGWVGFGLSGAAAKGWEPIYRWGRGYQPITSNYHAIQSFYNDRVRSECGVGRQIAQYATQAELYGPQAFDAEFAKDEIVIGTFNKLHRTRSILLGSHAGELFADGLARATAQLGRQAFVGLPGFIHAVDRATLTDISNQAENFVIYDVTSDAANALRNQQGFAYYNARNEELWQLAQNIRAGSGHKFQRLLIDKEPELRRDLNTTERTAVEAMDNILADPFYSGFMIYVHAQGVQAVGYHIARLLDRNPGTPFRIELALHNLHTELYLRYARHQIHACLRSTAATNAAR